MSKLLTGSIDVSKIDKARLFKSGKTRRSYLNVSIWVNDENDQFGNCASIQQSTKKGEDKIYLGNLKEFMPTVQAEEVTTNSSQPEPGDDNLPF